MVQRGKMDSYDEEIVRIYEERNQLMKEKRRCCRVIAELEKLYNHVDKLERKALTSKPGTNNKLKNQRYMKTSSKKSKVYLRYWQGRSAYQ